MVLSLVGLPVLWRPGMGAGRFWADRRMTSGKQASPDASLTALVSRAWEKPDFAPDVLHRSMFGGGFPPPTNSSSSDCIRGNSTCLLVRPVPAPDPRGKSRSRPARNRHLSDPPPRFF